MYHYIGDYYDSKKTDSNNNLMHGLAVPTAMFELQMRTLKNKGYQTTDFDTLNSWSTNKTGAPKGRFMLTFDDGYADFYSNAFPILKKYNFHATIYVITQFVGHSGYLNWDNIKELQQSGLVTIGSHTLSHKNLPSLSIPDLNKEVVQSKFELEQHLGIPIKDFCYPSGEYSSDVVNAVVRAGYRDSVTTASGRWDFTQNLQLIPRTRISGYMPLDTFSGMF